MPEVIYKVDLPAFTGRNVPIKEIAQAMGKDAQYVRVGLQQGILKFGTAIKVGNSNEFSYYCPDKKVWEETGYFRDVSELSIFFHHMKIKQHIRHHMLQIHI